MPISESVRAALGAAISAGHVEQINCHPMRIDLDALDRNSVSPDEALKMTANAIGEALQAGARLQR